MSKGFVIGPLKARPADGSTAWLKIFDKAPSSCTVVDCAEEEFVENREGVGDESLLLDRDKKRQIHLHFLYLPDKSYQLYPQLNL